MRECSERSVKLYLQNQDTPLADLYEVDLYLYVDVLDDFRAADCQYFCLRMRRVIILHMHAHHTRGSTHSRITCTLTGFLSTFESVQALRAMPD
jgi:hypothetical protein